MNTNRDINLRPQFKAKMMRKQTQTNDEKDTIITPTSSSEPFSIPQDLLTNISTLSYTYSFLSITAGLGGVLFAMISIVNGALDTIIMRDIFGIGALLLLFLISMYVWLIFTDLKKLHDADQTNRFMNTLSVTTKHMYMLAIQFIFLIIFTLFTFI